MEVSPTTAVHASSGLGERVDFILDAGPCEVGIESTVLSVASERRILLRPGMISQRQIEEVIGPVDLAPEPASGAGHVSPGLHRRHYAPKTPLYLLNAGESLPDGRGKAARAFPMSQRPLQRVFIRSCTPPIQKAGSGSPSGNRPRLLNGQASSIGSHAQAGETN